MLLEFQTLTATHVPQTPRAILPHADDTANQCLRLDVANAVAPKPGSMLPLTTKCIPVGVVKNASAFHVNRYLTRNDPNLHYLPRTVKTRVSNMCYLLLQSRQGVLESQST